MSGLTHSTASLLVVVAVTVALCSAGFAADYTVLHEFVIDPNQPSGFVQDAAGNFYATARGGGAANRGAVLKMSASGQFTILHSFSATEGKSPNAGLVDDAVNGFLYGTTFEGGDSGVGTVFKIDKSTGAVTVLHSFGSSPTDASFPNNGLIRGGDGNLFGTSQTGGDNGGGTVFRVDQSDAVLVLHSFPYFGMPDTSEGFLPQAGLLAVGDNFYGTTTFGGDSGKGTIFTMTMDGDFAFVSPLASFSAAVGFLPVASLVQADGTGTTFYGTALDGGTSGGCGTIFKVTTAGALTALHSFGCSSTDPLSPFTALVKDGSGNFYGTTFSGGASFDGVVFKMTTDGTPTGTSVTSLHEFAGSDGANPLGSLILANDGSTLYGTASNAGQSNLGVVFKLSTPAGAGFTAYPLKGTEGTDSRGGLIRASDGKFYGTTRAGGAFGGGTVFSMDPDGTFFTTVHSFKGGSTDGASPRAGVIQGSDGNLYGTTEGGGLNTNGTVFKMTPDGAGGWNPPTILHAFGLPTVGDGGNPRAPLVQGTDGKLYGATVFGGSFAGSCGSGCGIVFRIDTTGSGYQVLHTFTGGAGGANPTGVIQADDGKFYGTARGGGSAGGGTAFRIGISSGGAPTFATIHSFPNTEEGNPNAPLVQGSDGKLYGVTIGNSEGQVGTLFKMTKAGARTLLHPFAFGPGDGHAPEAPLIQGSDGNFYGTTASGGSSGNGTVFRMVTNGTLAGTTVTILHSFSGSDGQQPVTPLVQFGANLFGTTSFGGSTTGGVIFRLDAGLPSGGGPTLTSTSINAIGAGVTTSITLSGDNLDQFTFSGPSPDTISFVCTAGCAGPGITIVPGSITVSTDGKSITFKISVPGSQRGLYNIVITHGTQQFSLSNAVTVAPPPTVISAGTGLNGSGDLRSPLTGVLKGQTVIVKGTGFQAPTTVPSDLLVSIAGTGITVNSVAFGVCVTDGETVCQLIVDVDVTAGSDSVPLRAVTVTNPDLGSATSSGEGSFLEVVCCAPNDAPAGLAPSRTSGTASLPPQPTVITLTPSAAPIGALVTITGTKFSTTPANNFVTFTGPQGSRVLANITNAKVTSLTVQVPFTAQDGFVIVAVSGAEQSTAPNPLNFTVTNPVLTAATIAPPDPDAGQPASGRRGGTVTIDLIGSKFQQGATVAFDPNPPGDLTTPSVAFVDATHLQVTVQVSSTAQLGFRKVTVTNPNGNGSSSLDQGFEVKLNNNLAFSLERVTGSPAGPVAIGDFLPSVESVQIDLDAAGQCTSRTITPTVYLLRATVTSGSPPPSLTFILTSTNYEGTATNDNCEPSVPASFDYSVSGETSAPDVTSQRVTAQLAGGVYTVRLASWDWGGSVHIDVQDDTGTVGDSLSLPLNARRREDPTKTANDGLTDFEKYRGVYFVAPRNGTTFGQLQGHRRLDRDDAGNSALGRRNLFVRGVGFAGDRTLPPGKCGVDITTVPPTPQDANLLAPMPCPNFKVGGAFAEVGVEVWDVTDSFDAAGTTVFPTRSFADPSQPMLDLLTVSYDTKNCSGGAACDHTSKLGPRQWNFPTLGFSTFGTCCAYGNAIVLGKAFKAYFLDRPYKHQNSPPGTFLPLTATGQPQLAPPTIVCDKATKGADNGTLQPGECAAFGAPGGDVYVPGRFDQDMSAMATRTDGCVELPFAADPTQLPANSCPAGEPGALNDSASGPQATFQRVVRHVVTHEIAHAVGIIQHTGDLDDLMYMYSINWTRDNNFSPQAQSLIQIHNKGQQ